MKTLINFIQKIFHILIIPLASLSYVTADEEVGPFCPGETPHSFNDKKSCCEFAVDPFDPYCDGEEVPCPYDLGCNNCK